MFYPKELVLKFCNRYEDILTRNNRQWYVLKNGSWQKGSKPVDSLIKKFLKHNGIKAGFTGLWMFKADCARFLKYRHEVRNE